MKLYNTLSNSLEPFTLPGEAKIYTCGITPYDTTHLGHAFTYAVSDILIRFLAMQGVKVSYVQNVTDIDDDILKKAKAVGEDWRTLGNRWTRHFIEDMQTLNVRPPDFYPRATEVIPGIIQHVSDLLHHGVAYECGGYVYFDVHRWSEFGSLSRLPFDEMLPIANERGNNPDDPHKRHPLDFVLWQAQANDEPAWSSPWGMGRPGWHIECSTMSTQFLGETIDIHSGGGDLLFPHHECEIAQVEPLTGKKPFVRFWMHVAMVYHQGEKMSKSLGNLVMVRDLLKDWSPDAIRIYLGMHHYRKSWSHDMTRLGIAQQLADRMAKAAAARGGEIKPLDPTGFRDSFIQALNHDLDAPAGLEVIKALVERILDASEAGQDVSAAQKQLRDFGHVYGLRLNQPPDPDVMAGWEKHWRKFR